MCNEFVGWAGVTRENNAPPRRVEAVAECLRPLTVRHAERSDGDLVVFVYNSRLHIVRADNQRNQTLHAIRADVDIAYPCLEHMLRHVLDSFGAVDIQLLAMRYPRREDQVGIASRMIRM